MILFERRWPRVAMAVGAMVVSSMLRAQETGIDPKIIAEASVRAQKTVATMRADERTTLTHGRMPTQADAGSTEVIQGAGYIAGLPRLNIPSLRETDASLGVGYFNGARKDGATALPSGLAQAASWNPQILYAGGKMAGAEARAKGFNVLLAGGVNLMRDPRNGRSFEYLSEDPLLSGTLVGAAIAGVQSNHIISTIKHFALNGQETGRGFADGRISEAAARESDLLAFEIGIEKGQPLSVMCAYNQVNGAKACQNDWLLNTVLKKDWGWKGFVMSDWGAVPALDTAINGLDQQSGSQFDPKVFFAEPLAAKAKAEPAWNARLDDMNRRILTAIYATEVDKFPAAPGGPVDEAAHAAIAAETAKQGIVLLRNEGGLLPLAASTKRIAVIGGYANASVLSGGGSSQVDPVGGPIIDIPLGDKGPFATFAHQHYNGSSPLDAIRALTPAATVTYRAGDSIADAVDQARKADIAIVFATKWATEGRDMADLVLGDGQDELIAAVAKANPHTIVVLETGNPVIMPWLNDVPAVIEAWYPGAKGGEAIADVLFGRFNPSGRLPVTFPASLSQLPRPVLDGYFDFEPDISGRKPHPDAQLTINYDIEGADVGYRWFARQKAKALFPFGYGLSYTKFIASGLKLDGLKAHFTLTNTGGRDGAEVAQLYLVSRNGKPALRLAGFARVQLKPGEKQDVSITIDRRILANWQGNGWQITTGVYSFALGRDAENLGPSVTITLPAQRWAY